MSYNFENFKELETLSQEEKDLTIDILKQLSNKGESKILDNLIYSDYDEIPVDIETFLKDKKYLGNGLIDAEGRFTVFPFWQKTLKKIFPNNLDTSYNTLVLTGGIGLGKSFVAVLCQLYLLYRMICLKDPYLHYGLQPIDKITFSLINITLDAAKGVAWDKMQQLLQTSPWFMEHGTVTGRSELIWKPPKGIELVIGSSNNAVIGRALFCLDGETQIKTSKGDFKLKDLVDKQIKVLSLNDDKKLIESDFCTVKPTIKTNEEYEIELENGCIIKCTPNHKLMLKDGTYKEAKDLTEDDELFDIYEYDLFISNIINTRGQWDETLRNKNCERHHIIPKCLGGIPKTLDWSHHLNIIWLTASEHFIAHKLLALKYPTNHKLICAYKRMFYGKNKTIIKTPEDYNFIKERWRKLHSEEMKGRLWTLERKINASKNFSDDRKKQLSQRFSGNRNNMFGKGYKIAGAKNGCYGHPVEPTRKENIIRGRSKFIYVYNNREFYGWKQLQQYLKQCGFVKISQLSIEKLAKQDISIKKTYPQLYGQIQRYLKEGFTHEN